MTYDRPLFLPAGDQAVVVELGDAIDPETNRRVHNLARAVGQLGVQGVIDLVPTYRSLLVNFDPMQISPDELESELAEIDTNADESETSRQRVVHLPTLYGGDHGPDLPFVAEHAGLTVEEVVSLHSGVDYLIYMMGFTPGFPYLGELPKRLVTPRLETPRPQIPAGSVGIAEGQTGVYPATTPGGWRLIGRTPLRLFDSGREPPAMLSAGDFVRFVPMAGEGEYERVRKLAEAGGYEVVVETKS